MEAFNRDNPGLLDEIMREMGSDNFNKIFYDYDPKYDPSEDVDVQRDLEAMVQAAYDKASDNIHLRPIENRLSSMSREDKLSLVESLNKPEELKQIVIRLGGVVEPVVTSIDLHDKEIFDDLPESELKRAKESALHDAVKIFIKNNWDEFVDTVSLKEILQNPGKYFILLNPGIHLSKKQLTEVLDDNFREFIGAEQRREYQHSHPMYKEKVSFKNATKERINRVLYSLLIQYLKSQGHSNARAFAGMEEIFEKFEKVSPEEYEHLVAVADPANYF